MTEVKNALKPRCQKCHLLDTETAINTSYAGNEIIHREIIVDCKFGAVCDAAEDRLKGSEAE
jgi:hypothetical protein